MDLKLLLKDLSARLPYSELMVQYKGEDFNVINIGFGRVTLIKPFMSFTSGSPLIDEVKPYLRPMSSMTEEEKKEYRNFIEFSYNDYTSESKECVYTTNVNNYVDWLNKNMFDYRGLIPLGLALEAPTGMY